jgi:two-component system, OmpR family, sensor histidine kinase KdpD
MLYLLAVVLVAVKLGRRPAVFMAFLSVAAFDFCFVPPRFSFTVSDAQYLITFGVMLAVALIIGQLTANLKYQARVAINRETRANALSGLARELSGALLLEQIAEIASRYVENNFKSTAAVVLADAENNLGSPIRSGDSQPFALDDGILHWVFDHGEPAGIGTDTLPASAILYLPLRAPMRIRGVLAIAPRSAHWLLIPEQRRQLETFAALIAIAIERIHYVDIAQSTTVQIESERLRNSLLASLSHDLRTPLTGQLGLAEALLLTKPALSSEQSEIAYSIRDAALRMTTLVNNLLDMSRLQAGEVKLNRQWQPLEEVIGAVLANTKMLLARHTVVVHLPAGLPLVDIDAVLMERVFENILDNAHKYTPVGTRIDINASAKDAMLEIVVEDSGPGFHAGKEEEIFKKFTRGETESNTPGVGLGLAICRAIVEAHRGNIRAERSSHGGARFVIELPLGIPPTVALE